MAKSTKRLLFLKTINPREVFSLVDCKGIPIFFCELFELSNGSSTNDPNLWIMSGGGIDAPEELPGGSTVNILGHVYSSTVYRHQLQDWWV